MRHIPWYNPTLSKDDNESLLGVNTNFTIVAPLARVRVPGRGRLYAQLLRRSTAVSPLRSRWLDLGVAAQPSQDSSTIQVRRHLRIDAVAAAQVLRWGHAAAVRHG